MRLIKNYCYLIALLGLFPASANALMLNYTGNNFDNIANKVPSFNQFSITDNVLFSLTLTEALGNNLNNQAISPVSFTASAGTLVLSNFTATRSKFLFSTDSVGQITDWIVGAQSTAVGGYSKDISSSNFLFVVGDIGKNFLCGLGGCTGALLNTATNVNNPGTWSYQAATQPPAPSTVPEPGTLALFALGLLGLAYRKTRIA